MDYELGLRVLGEIAKVSEWFEDYAVLEARLRENLRDEHRYGPSEQSRRDRAQVVDQLNNLARPHLKISFNDLCLGILPAHPQPSADRGTLRILFLSANPKDTDRLRLDEEVRTMDERLHMSEARGRFQLAQHWAVRTSDISEYLLRHTPHVVHFSGHGSTQGEIILENSSGEMQPVPPSSLSQLFGTLKDNIRCVVLNACFSANQAQAIAQEIDCVVGMSRAVTDEAAIRFAGGFYRALGYGRSVQTAFNLGKLEIELDLPGLGEDAIPQLLAKQGVDPASITFSH